MKFQTAGIELKTRWGFKDNSVIILLTADGKCML